MATKKENAQYTTNEYVMSIIIAVLTVMLVALTFIPMTDSSEYMSELEKNNKIKTELIQMYKIRDGIMIKLDKTNKFIIEEQDLIISELDIKVTNLQTKLNDCRKE